MEKSGDEEEIKALWWPTVGEGGIATKAGIFLARWR